MKLSRPLRFIAALIALLSVLFMQYAVASYACPGISMGEGGNMSLMSADMNYKSISECDGTDAVQPNLCHAYDHMGKQSVDKPELPQVQPFIAVGLALPVNVVTLVLPDTAPSVNGGWTHPAEPPLTIRNCCFRI